MNPQEKPSSVEDLTVTEDQAADVKGGVEVPFYLKVESVEGDSAMAGGALHGGYTFKETKKI